MPTLEDQLSVDASWLSETGSDISEWVGPGPCLPNIQKWIGDITELGASCLVRVIYAAAKISLPQWDRFHAGDSEFAMESLGESQPPDAQLRAIKRWIDSPGEDLARVAFELTDPTKQLYWFHEEYEDIWFEHRGMWAVEAAEFNILTLASSLRQTRSTDSAATDALISLVCSLNSLRSTADDTFDEPVLKVLDAVKEEFRAEHLLSPDRQETKAGE